MKYNRKRKRILKHKVYLENTRKYTDTMSKIKKKYGLANAQTNERLDYHIWKLNLFMWETKV